MKNDLEWSKLFGYTTNGAPAMLRKKLGFQFCIKAESREIIFLFTILCAKVLLPELLSWLQETVMIINFMKTFMLNIRLFTNLCSHHKCLFFYTDVC